ncbi:MAG: sulfotransferase domain-containing protein [Cyanobacteriota bacterium]|nr:sulfotransferase domain-containing protein [Cyanobacteriota bacterium]
MNIQRDRHLLAFLGHHKCATTFFRRVVESACKEMGLNYFLANKEAQFGSDLKSFVDREKIDFIAYTNANYEQVKDLTNFRGFHVIRDPRDIIVSAYFSHLYSHPTQNWPALAEYRNKLKNLSKDEGLLLEIERSGSGLRKISGWDYSLPNVLELKMEDIIVNPYSACLDIFDYLQLIDKRSSYVTLTERWKELLALTVSKIQQVTFGQDFINFSSRKMSGEKLCTIVYQHDFRQKSKGRKPGEENVKSHYRKGVAGDWKNHFNEQHIELFKKNYKGLLVKLGYEDDENW